MKFALYQQGHGTLKPVGTIEARSGSEAIDLAKRLAVFLKAPRNTLGHYPAVERIDHDQGSAAAVDREHPKQLH